MANIIYARVMQKTATLDEWMSSDLVLLDGEQAFVVSGDGTPINFKIGDGTKTFSELPFWIQYDQAQYISVDSNALPTPTQDAGYSIVGSGTYTKAGQADVVVPSGHMGILNWDGSVWYLGSSVEMPDNSARIPDWEQGNSYKSGELLFFEGGIFESKIDNQGAMHPDDTNIYTEKVAAHQGLLSTGYFIEPGGISKVDGSDIDNVSSVERTDFVRVVEGVKYKFIGTEGSTTCAVFFYDKNFNPLSAMANDVGDRIDVSLSSDDMPLGTKFFRAAKHVKYKDSITIESLSKKVLNQKWQEDVFTISGEGVNRYGDFFTNETLKRTDFITIDTDTSFRATVFQGVEATGVFFYGWDRNPIGYMDIPSGAIDLNISSDDIPSGAYFVVFTCNRRQAYVKRYYGTNSLFNEKVSNRYISLMNRVDVFSYEGEGVDKETGAVVSSPSTVRTGYLNIDNLVSVRGFEGSTVSMVYFYSDSYIPLGAATLEGGVNQVHMHQVMGEYPNAKYAIVTALLSDDRKYVEVKSAAVDSEGDFLPDFMLESQACQYQHIFNKSVGSQIDMSIKINDGYQPKWYGVSWEEGSDPDNVLRIGDMGLHTQLPIQNKMKRCIIKNGMVQYYLHPDDSTLKQDGSDAVLDGSDGDVMVEIPSFYYKFIKEGGVCELRLSEDAIPGFVFCPKRYTSAFEASINNDNQSLSSVVTTVFDFTESEIFIEDENTYFQSNSGYSLGNNMVASISGYTQNAEIYRGGDGNAEYDGVLDPTDNRVSLNCLGRPRSNLNKRQCRLLAKNRGDGATMYLYDTHKSLYMLSLVEFANRDFQSTELGKGATVYPNYNAANSYYDMMRAIIPTGVTLKLGNSSGEVYYDMKMAANSTDESDFKDVWMPVMSYRGVENFYGHQYKLVDQIKVRQRNISSTGNNNTISQIDYLYNRNPFLTDNNFNNSIEVIGSFVFNPYIKVISELLLGDDFHILPTNTSTAGHSTNYADSCEIKSNEDDFDNTYLKEVSFAGRYVSGTLCGPLFICSEKKESLTTKEYSRECNVTRFDFIASE